MYFLQPLVKNEKQKKIMQTNTQKPQEIDTGISKEIACGYNCHVYLSYHLLTRYSLTSLFEYILWVI